MLQVGKKKTTRHHFSFMKGYSHIDIIAVGAFQSSKRILAIDPTIETSKIITHKSKSGKYKYFLDFDESS